MSRWVLDTALACCSLLLVGADLRPRRPLFFNWLVPQLAPGAMSRAATTVAGLSEA